MDNIDNEYCVEDEKIESTDVVNNNNDNISNTLKRGGTSLVARSLHSQASEHGIPISSLELLENNETKLDAFESNQSLVSNEDHCESENNIELPEINNNKSSLAINNETKSSLKEEKSVTKDSKVKFSDTVISTNPIPSFESKEEESKTSTELPKPSLKTILNGNNNNKHNSKLYLHSPTLGNYSSLHLKKDGTKSSMESLPRPSLSNFLSPDLSNRKSKYGDVNHFLSKTEYSKDKIPDRLKTSKKQEFVKYLKKIGLLFEMELFQTVLAFAYLVASIVGTYTDMEYSEKLLALQLIDLVVCTLFIIFFFVHFFLAEDKLSFLVHPASLLDYLTVFPTFVICIISLTDMENVWFSTNIYTFIKIIGVFRVLSVFRVIPFIKKLSQSNQISSVVVVFSGLFQWLENTMTDRNITFHESLYFLFITLFTIGYGDYYPKSPVSQYAVVVFFVIGAVVVPYQASALFNLMTSPKTIFKVNNLRLNKHAIVSGNARLTEILDFLKELLHSQHGKLKLTKVILLFKDKELCDQLQESITQFNDTQPTKLVVFCGDILDFNTLQFLNISTAHSAFLLNSPKFGDEKKQDTSIIMTTIALKNFNSKLKVHAQINYLETRPYLLKAGAKAIICNEYLSSKILSLSTVLQGFGTLISNLVFSVESNDVWGNTHLQERYQSLVNQNKKKKKKNKNNESSESSTDEEDILEDSDTKWILEYIDSLSCEIYREKLSPYFHNSLFMDAYMTVKDKFEITLFAIEDSNGTLQLNPEGYTIKSGDIGYCIAKSSAHASLLYLYQNINEGKEGVKEQKEKHKSAETNEDNFDTNYTDYLEKEQATFEFNVSGLDIGDLGDIGAIGIGGVGGIGGIGNVGKIVSGISTDTTKPKRRLSEANKKKSVGFLFSSKDESVEIHSLRKSPTVKSNPTTATLLEKKKPTRIKKKKDEGLLDAGEELTSREIDNLYLSIAPETYFRRRKTLLDNFKKENNKDNNVYSKILESQNLLKTPRMQDSFLINSYMDPYEIKDHILVMGNLKQSNVLCSAIRSKKEFLKKTIVLMCGDDCTDPLYEKLKYFDNIYFITGSPSRLMDLRRAGVHVASCSILITHDKEESSNDVLDNSEYVIDSEAIKLVLSLEFIDPNRFFVMELTNRVNIKFMQNFSNGVSCWEKEKSILAHGIVEHDLDEFDQFCLFSDLYTSGRIFTSSSMLVRVLAQSFFNKKITSLIELMCLDGYLVNDTSIFLVDCPKVYLDLTVFDITTKLYEYELILISISRWKHQPETGEGELDSNNNLRYNVETERNNIYLYSNPRLCIRLLPGDRLFLCGKRNNYNNFLIEMRDNANNTTGEIEMNEDIFGKIVIDDDDINLTTPPLQEPCTKNIKPLNGDGDTVITIDDISPPRMSFDQLLYNMGKHPNMKVD